jgi:hypothetical protein
MEKPSEMSNMHFFHKLKYQNSRDPPLGLDLETHVDGGRSGREREEEGRRRTKKKKEKEKGR